MPPIVLCRGCGVPIRFTEDGYLVNDRVADGCSCNSPRGINHGLVPAYVCTCSFCDPAQTGSVRPLRGYAEVEWDDGNWGVIRLGGLFVETNHDWKQEGF